VSLDEQQDPGVAHSDEQLSIPMEVSKAMVTLFKQHFGRGPTGARTYWAGPDALVVFLENTLTPAERNLAEMGAHQKLRDVRLYFQYATIQQFCEPVEQITGRKVRSFHSSTDTKVEGFTVETFIFWPEGQDGPSRIDLAGDDEV
jgi:uncharacterized protein YbcI